MSSREIGRFNVKEETRVVSAAIGYASPTDRVAACATDKSRPRRAHALRLSGKQTTQHSSQSLPQNRRAHIYRCNRLEIPCRALPAPLPNPAQMTFLNHLYIDLHTHTYAHIQTGGMCFVYCLFLSALSLQLPARRRTPAHNCIHGVRREARGKFIRTKKMHIAQNVHVHTFT